MSSHQVTVLVWALLGLAMLVLEGLSRLEGSRIPTFSALVTRAMRTPSGRVGVLAGWLWLGLHYFSK